MTTFDIVALRSGQAAVVRVRGELDLSTAPLLDKQLVRLADEGVQDVTIDLADLDFIDSSGLSALVAGLKRLREQGGDLELRSLKPRMLRMLEITGVTSVFRLVGDSGPGAHCVDWQMPGEHSPVAADQRRARQAACEHRKPHR